MRKTHSVRGFVARVCDQEKMWSRSKIIGRERLQEHAVLRGWIYKLGQATLLSKF